MLSVNPDGSIVTRDPDATEFDLDRDELDVLRLILDRIDREKRFGVAMEIRWLINNTNASVDTMTLLSSLNAVSRWSNDGPPF